MTESKKAAAAFAKNEDRKKHRKSPKESRGRKRIRKRQYKPVELRNELITRSRNLLSQSGKKWGEHKRERARLLFELHPQLKEGYSLICKVRSVFKKKISVDEARKQLHEWYQDVSTCSLREIKAARECIKYKEKDVLNHFKNRSTNASAESLNSKMKGFRAQLHGISDIPFFIYRLCTIFG